jgi:hypothetical protein
MNANYGLAAWNGWPQMARKRLKCKQLGFMLFEAERPPGLPARVANAHARFEYQARQAAREWLMV